MISLARVALPVLICVAASIALSGCTAMGQQIQPSPNREALVDPNCAGAAVKKDCLASYAYQQINKIDVNYNRYKEDLFYGSSSGSLIADLGILGTTLAATSATGVATKATLSAIAAGITGTRTAINSDVLYNNSLLSLIAKMDSDRAQQKVAMIKVISSTTGYTSYDQLSGDLITYYQAGEIHNAIIGITNSAGAKLSQCSADETSLKAGGAATNGC